jgi:predicted  nucleic acid-binding Zn-ribbon protein
MDKMERLKNARAKVEELARKKERISGQLEAKRKRVNELEAKARDEFDCEVNEIPDLVEKLDAEATEALNKAERMLGMVVE